MKYLITGGAGFIGSNLVDRLVAEQHQVVVLDNFATGQSKFLEHHRQNEDVEIVNIDLLDFRQIEKHFDSVDVVIHLAANADVRFGWQHPRRDLEQNVLVTQNILECMRRQKIRKLIFSSTGSVYGDATVIPTPEDCPFPQQTSLYGASKAAAEGLISAYSENGFIDATIFRFVSILGPRYTHGHVIDFVAKLTENPNKLQVLGNGKQQKSYLHVFDCVSAIVSQANSSEPFEVYNLGTDETCTVDDSVGWITSRLGLNPQIEHTGGRQGWVGDNPLIHLDTSKIRSAGWRPRYSIKESVENTVDWIMENTWVLELAVRK